MPKNLKQVWHHTQNRVANVTEEVHRACVSTVGDQSVLSWGGTPMDMQTRGNGAVTSKRLALLYNHYGQIAKDLHSPLPLPEVLEPLDQH